MPPLDHLTQIHLRREREVVLRGRLFQASVADQMFRGQWAVDAGIVNGWIGPKKSLVILGGGVAGISAAIRASNHRDPHSQEPIDVTLVDSSLRPFELQRGVNARHIDPTGYHWPHSGSHPSVVRNAPLPVGFSDAETAVVDWETEWLRVSEQQSSHLWEFLGRESEG